MSRFKYIPAYPFTLLTHITFKNYGIKDYDLLITISLKNIQLETTKNHQKFVFCY